MMELVRRAVRDRIGYKSTTYRLAARVYTDASILLREGVGTYSLLHQLRSVDAKGLEPREVAFRTLKHPIFLRPGTADIGTAVNNFVRGEYGAFDFPSKPKTLIDAGAYIGDTSAYFLSRFPDMQAIALEPNPESFRMAARNLAPYGARVTLLPLALCAKEGSVSMSGAETGARVGGGEGTTVEATTVAKLLERFPDRRVDILKMDIEGAEDDIFLSDIGAWLPRVGCIVVETHGPKITENVLGALRKHGWRTSRFRNLYFARPRA